MKLIELADHVYWKGKPVNAHITPHLFYGLQVKFFFKRDINNLYSGLMFSSGTKMNRTKKFCDLSMVINLFLGSGFTGPM